MRLIPYCFATDSAANTIYGYTLGRKDGTTSNTFYNILIKSNPNPRSDLTDLTWTVVSVSPLSRNHILDIYTGNDQTYNCAIDDNGVFSVLSRRYSPSFDIESYEYIPRGLQFHPHSSKDVWTNIDTDPSAVYSKNWEESCPSQLFNFKDVAGQDNLMHVVAQQDSPGGVYVATFDSSSSMMKIGPAWLLDQSKYGTNKAVFYTPGSIHSLGLNGSQAILTSIPVTSSSITPPVGSATIRNVSATIGAKCPEALSRFRAHTLGNNGIISCMNWSAYKLNIFIFNDTSFVTVPQINGEIGLGAMTAVKGSDGVSFLFLHRTYGMYSYTIDGPSPGTRVGVEPNISINEGFGGGPTVPEDPWDRPSDSRLPLGLFIGMGVGCAVIAIGLAFCIGCCVRHRLRQRRREAQIQS